MSFNILKKIPSREEVLKRLPLDNKLKTKKENNDNKIKDILDGTDNRLIVIVGPCSVDTTKAILKYLDMLEPISQELKDKLLIVPRIYSGKPRTTGDGYKGIIHQTIIDDEPSILDGIMKTRELKIRIIKDYDMPSADEILYTAISPYLEDTINYVAIGARSVYNQEHRLMASGISSPVGMKNPMSGNIWAMLNAIYASQNKHNFMYGGYEVNTSGNMYSHGILRGYIDNDDRHFNNYNYDDLKGIIDMYEKTELLNKSLIVDASHSNSNKEFARQPLVIENVVKNMKKHNSFKNIIKGFMIESYIEEGSDKTGNVFGKSLTDGCLGFEDTKRVLYNLAEKI